MNLLNIQFRVNADMQRARRKLLEELRTLGHGSRVFQRMVKFVGDFDQKQNDQTFKNEGTNSGPKWAALTPAYAAWKAGKRKEVSLLRAFDKQMPSQYRRKHASVSNKILQYSGSMRKSLVQRGPDRIVRFNGMTLEIGTRHKLATYHQTGTKRMKARPPVRKSGVQIIHLKLCMARELLLGLASHTGKPLSTQLRMSAGMVRPDPRR